MNWELHNLYSSPDIFSIIKSRGMRCCRNVACQREHKCVEGFCGGGGEQNEERAFRRSRRLWQDNIKMEQNGNMQTESSVSQLRRVMGSCEDGSKPSRSTAYRELTFRHRASSIQDRRFVTLQRTLFVYLINKYISLSDIFLTVHH